jgi:O-antigen/teichoic acid export membrane protein
LKYCLPVYSTGKWVLIIYSAGMLWVTIIGMAAIITETSKYYRVSTLFLLISVIAQFILSYFLIPRYGITGAAVATIITLFINFGFQALLQRVAFGITGISIKILPVLLFGLISFGAGWLLPGMSLIPDIILRSALVSLLYVGMIYLSGISPETNSLIRGFFRITTGRA